MKAMIQCFVIMGFVTCVNAQAAPCPETPSVAMNNEVTVVFNNVKSVQSGRLNGRLCNAGECAITSTPCGQASDCENNYAQILGPLAKRDGTVALPHGLRHPSDRSESPLDLGFNANVLLGYSIDENRGPGGTGYAVHAEFERNTNTCRASVQLGNHDMGFPDAATFTTPEWYLVEEIQ